MIIAVDTGGTKTLLALFSEDGSVIKSYRFVTPKDQDEYLAELARQVSDFTSGVDSKEIRALTLASPGLINDTTILWGGGNLPWKNVHVGKTLQSVLPPGTPIFVENDANLGALGEVRSLKQNYRMAMYVTISTGIGAGIVTDGILNPYLLGSEVGHMPLEFDGHVKRWETFASGKAIKRAYGKYAKDITSKRAWNHITDRISRGFLVLIPVLRPDVIIIGGSIGTHFEKYGGHLQDLLREQTLPSITVPPIIQATKPEEAVVYGCYYHALNCLDRR